MVCESVISYRDVNKQGENAGWCLDHRLEDEVMKKKKHLIANWAHIWQAHPTAETHVDRAGQGSQPCSRHQAERGTERKSPSLHSNKGTPAQTTNVQE